MYASWTLVMNEDLRVMMQILCPLFTVVPFLVGVYRWSIMNRQKTTPEDMSDKQRFGGFHPYVPYSIEPLPLVKVHQRSTTKITKNWWRYEDDSWIEMMPETTFTYCNSSLIRAALIPCKKTLVYLVTWRFTKEAQSTWR